MEMTNTAMRGRGVPLAPGKERRTVTLPEALVRRVRAYWHARQLNRESQAFEELLEIGLEHAEKSAAPDDKPKRRRS